MANKTTADASESAGKGGAASQSGPESKSSPTATGVVDSAKQAASQAKEAASNVFDKAKNQAASGVDQQRKTVASGMQAVAHAFQSMGEELRGKDQGPIAEYAAEMGQAISGQVEQFANYIRDHDVRQLVTETEEFARRSPVVFLGGAFVLGLAASRFLKSSRATSGAASGKSTPAQSTPSSQPALPPAPPPPAEEDLGLPSGFPFSPAKLAETRSGTGLTGGGGATPRAFPGSDPAGSK